MLNKLTHIARTDTAHTKDSIPDFEDPKLIIQVHANKCVEITDFINKDKCAPCDVEDIETLISEYEFDEGTYYLQIHVAWVQDVEGWNATGEWDSEWEFIVQRKI